MEQSVPSLKITELSAQNRNYKTGEVLEVLVDIDGFVGTVTATLLIKAKTPTGADEYTNTGMIPIAVEKTCATLSVSLTGMQVGSYCLMLTVNSNNQNVLQVPFCFVIT